MYEHGSDRVMRDDRVMHVYPLPPGATVQVTPGTIVAAGDLLATVPPRTWLAYADELRLSHAESAREIERKRGTTVEENERLGSNRVHLMTHTVRAPIAGLLDAMPESGALLIRPTIATRAVLATEPGTIIEATADRIAIETQVVRIRFAYATGSLPRRARLLSRSDGEPQQSSATETSPSEMIEDAHIMPHIARMSDLKSATYRTSCIIVGSVPDAIAWELISRGAKNSAHGAHLFRVIILSGPGSADDGVAAIAQMSAYDGTICAIDARARLITCATGDSPVTRGVHTEPAADPVAARLRDPAHWGTTQAIGGIRQLARLESGHRTLVRAVSESGTDERTIPETNVEIVSKR